MKNLLTKILFISLLSSAAIPSGIQALDGNQFVAVLGVLAAAGIGIVVGVVTREKTAAKVAAVGVRVAAVAIVAIVGIGVETKRRIRAAVKRRTA